MELYKPEPTNLWDEGIATTSKIWNRNFKQLEKQDREAKKAKKLVGRYISMSMADGKAFYQIVKENKKSVRIKVCIGLGDDWKVPYWGKESTIGKDYAASCIRVRDGINKIFSRK